MRLSNFGGEMKMKIIGISGSLSGYKTMTIVFKVLKAAKSLNPNIETELIDLKDYDVEFVNGAPLSFYNADTVKVVDTIMAADGLIIGTPIYQASISGVLKNLLDHLPVDGLMGKTVGMVATGGTDKHYLVMDYHLRSILTFLKANVAGSNVFVNDKYFDAENDIVNRNILLRFEHLAKEVLSIQQFIQQKS